MVGWYTGYTTMVVYPDRWYGMVAYVFYRVEVGWYIGYDGMVGWYRG